MSHLFLFNDEDSLYLVVDVKSESGLDSRWYDLSFRRRPQYSAGSDKL